MSLILDLLGPPRLMGARNRFELRFGSATIGRSPEADWVIPDLDRMISRRHLRIDLSGGDAVLTDTSSNGVYVNASKIPVGYGASVTLQHGDRLRVGEAEIAVAIADSAETAAQPGQPAEVTASRRPLGARDPHGGPFAASSGATSPDAMPAPRDRPGGAGEVIDANWMIQPAEGMQSPSALRDTPQPSYGFGPDASRAAPMAMPAGPPRPSVLALVEQQPGLSTRRLAEVIDTALQKSEPSARQSLHDEIDRLIRL